MFSLLTNIWGVALLILLFGVTIFVHELGHYLAARLLGLVVDVFSIGFGPAVWKRRIDNTVYKIGWVPFGGYVSLPQLDPAAMSRVQGKGTVRELPRIAAWRKIVVSVAGAVGNVLLAVVLAWVVFLVGIPGGPAERSAQVGFVEPETAAHMAGLRTGDEILEVNQRPVENWRDFRIEVALSETADLLVRSPDGTEKLLSVASDKGTMGEQILEGVFSCDLCEVMSASTGMSAAAAGIKSGDRIVEFGGAPVYSRLHLSDMVALSEDRTVPLKVVRGEGDDEQSLVMLVTPAFDPEVGRARIGVVFNAMAFEAETITHPPPGLQLRHHATMIVRVLQALVTPREAKLASRAIGGPVAIVISYWMIVRASIMLAISFTCLINVNLAIINLLPIPVLDGGHIVFSLWELIFRRPLPARVVDALVNVFAVLLIGVIIMLSVRDLDRFTSVGKRIRGLFGKGEQEAAEATGMAE